MTKQCQRAQPKALKPFNFNRHQNLGQTSVLFCLAKMPEQDGHCRDGGRFTNDQLLSTLVEFSILSAISLVGLAGRAVDLHMLLG